MGFLDFAIGFSLISYSILILWLILGVSKVQKFDSFQSEDYQCFSLLIPFRNEAQNFSDLLESIAKIEYPVANFEVLMIDDYSEDESVQIIEKFKMQNPHLFIHCISNNRKSIAPKKDAILTGIANSSYEWIFTTDADCILPPNGLSVLNDFIHQKKPVMVAGMVNYPKGNTFLERFQNLDWMSLTGVTMSGFGKGKPIICSGAHLVYQKQIFWEVGGFSGNENVASGDDVFLLAKMVKKYPEKVQYLYNQSTIVITKPLKSWKAVFEQHKRWMAKTGKTKNAIMIVMGLIVFVMNFFWLFFLLLSMFKFEYISYFLLNFFVKIVFDSLFLHQVFGKNTQKIDVFAFVISQFLYPFFSVFVTLSGFYYGYQWKGRKFLK